jgi:hypothetical protein
MRWGADNRDNGSTARRDNCSVGLPRETLSPRAKVPGPWPNAIDFAALTWRWGSPGEGRHRGILPIEQPDRSSFRNAVRAPRRSRGPHAATPGAGEVRLCGLAETNHLGAYGPSSRLIQVTALHPKTKNAGGLSLRSAQFDIAGPSRPDSY